MIQTQMNPVRHLNDETEFPVVYQDDALVVYTNGSGEIFVQPKDKRATARIGPDGCDGLRITAHGGTLVPGEVNCLSAINIRGGRPH